MLAISKLICANVSRVKIYFIISVVPIVITSYKVASSNTSRNSSSSARTSSLTISTTLVTLRSAKAKA